MVQAIFTHILQARVVTHVLARVVTHVLARVIMHVHDYYLKTCILETCDIWDNDYNSDNWETEFLTIFVTWQ